MKLYIYSIALTIVCWNTSSCKKNFLDVPTKNTLTLQEHVKDLPTTHEFLSGIYVLLAQDFFHGASQAYAEVIADNIKPVSATSTSLSVQYNWAQQADQNNTNNLNWNSHWTVGYKIIRSCNFAIAKAQEYRSEDPVKADDIKGQAYALRALLHFVLVNEFAQSYNFTTSGSHPGIPYITVYDWNTPVSGRQTVAEVYQFLITDLTNAIALMTSGATSTLYMTRLAAKALLARIYLFMEDYVNAKKLSVEVGIQKPIMQTNYPSNLFTPAETEALFQLPPSSTLSSVGGTYNTIFAGRFFNSGKSTLLVATSDIADLLTHDPLDLRTSWINSGDKDTISKYPVNVVSGYNPVSGSYYPTLLRSSEMYLTAAEAYARLNNDDSARYFVNEIRTRANILPLKPSVTGTTLLDSIYTERRKELAFEGLRMFDLLRWKKGVYRQDAWNASAQNLPYPSNKAIAPIPGLDVAVTGLQQNLDY